jgi:hypothetical protein
MPAIGKQASIFMVILGICLPNPLVARSKASVSYPNVVQGVWMSDDEPGRAQCRQYLEAYSRDKTTSDFLVGAEVITKKIWHSYAEYGEGNFYFPKSLRHISRNRWRASATIGIDTMVEIGEEQTSTFRFYLSAGKLIWVVETVAGKPVDSWDEHRYFRCAGVPSGFYDN